MHLIKDVLLCGKLEWLTFYFRSVFPGFPEVDRKTASKRLS